MECLLGTLFISAFFWITVHDNQNQNVFTNAFMRYLWSICIYNNKMCWLSLDHISSLDSNWISLPRGVPSPASWQGAVLADPPAVGLLFGFLLISSAPNRFSDSPTNQRTFWGKHESVGVLWCSLCVLPLLVVQFSDQRFPFSFSLWNSVHQYSLSTPKIQLVPRSAAPITYGSVSTTHTVSVDSTWQLLPSSTAKIPSFPPPHIIPNALTT